MLVFLSQKLAPTTSNSVTVPLIQAVSKNLANEILKQNGESRNQFDENLSVIEHK